MASQLGRNAEGNLNDWERVFGTEELVSLATFYPYGEKQEP
jgi:hypothetical protein